MLPGFITFLPLCFSPGSTPSPSMNCAVPDFCEPRSTNYSGVSYSDVNYSSSAMQVKGRTTEQSRALDACFSPVCSEFDDHREAWLSMMTILVLEDGEVWRHISRGSLRLACALKPSTSLYYISLYLGWEI